MGYVLSNENEADLIIVLSCSVRQKSMDRIFGKIKKWKKLPQKPKIIISACVLENDKRKLIDKVDAIINNKAIVKYLANNFKVKTQNQQIISDLNILPRNEHELTSLIPIMQGCNNFCTYCAVPYTRGREVSRSEKEVLKEINKQLKNGSNKILLLGQNVNSFGLRPKVTSNKQQAKNEALPFSKLLEEIDKIPGDFTYNFMSSNPHDFTDGLIDVLANLKKWERELHLPLQSGDDEILHKMNRKYNSLEYLSLIKNLKLKIKNLRLTTDVIVGFPSETYKQFQNTVKLCKKIGFSKAYVSQYSPRPQTVSAKTMTDDVPSSEKKYRWRILNDLINKRTPQGVPDSTV